MNDALLSRERECINWLYHVKGFGRKKMGVILSRGISAHEICEMPGGQLSAFLREKCGFSGKQADSSLLSLGELRRKSNPESLAEDLQKKEILFLLPGDPEYPKKLEMIPDAPFALYMKGKKEKAAEISAQSVAVIGARECSEYGRFAAEYIGRRCAQRGVPVVSGMAYGVDGIAQWAAAKEGGVVVAVLGSGVDVCYPHTNRKLYEYLTKEGCIFSEYVPGTEPKPVNFPPRNRIISGMADALVVVEAKEKSGTLITVDMALEQGKEVYVVPGRINDPMSRGCNRLIRQGASMVCDVDEMLAEITHSSLHNIYDNNKGQIEEAEENRMKNPYPPGELKHIIYKTMDMQPKSVQQIFDSPVWRTAAVEKPAITELQTELFYMRMQGTVWENTGRFGISR